MAQHLFLQHSPHSSPRCHPAPMQANDKFVYQQWKPWKELLAEMVETAMHEFVCNIRIHNLRSKPLNDDMSSLCAKLICNNDQVAYTEAERR